jgi:hypothetical protein
MSEARSIFRSRFADRVEAVSAGMRRRRWSLRQLLIALAAGLSLILAGLFGNFSRRARRKRREATDDRDLPRREAIIERGNTMSARTPYRWIEDAEARRVRELAAVKRGPLDPHITIVPTEPRAWQARPFAMNRWRPKPVTGRQWHFGRDLALFHMRWPLL